MREFREDSRGSRFGRGSRPSGDRFGGRGGGFGGRGGVGRDRDSDRRPTQMHDAVCTQCGKQCQVPFRPTGSKPVLCSECFRPDGNSGRSFGRGPSQSGASSEQFNQINAKLDKILLVLQDLEIDTGDAGEEFEDSDDTDESEEEKA